MTELLNLILLTSIWVLGLTIVTQEGMAFYRIREWAEYKSKNGSTWAEPLILCEWCMPSMHTTIGYLFAYLTGIISNDSRHLLLYPLVIMGSSLVSGVIWTIYETIAAIQKYFIQKEKLVRLEYNKKRRNGNIKRNSRSSV